MSFQGIRRMRQARKESPMLFESTQLAHPNTIKPVQFNFNLKSCLLNNGVRTTRDSQVQGEASNWQTRRGSFATANNSKEKDKKTLVGNFLHINLDSLRALKSNRDFKSPPPETSNTDRLTFNKSNTEANKSNAEDYERQIIAKISLSSFSLDFVVGKGGFGKVWKVHEKSTGRIFAMKQMLKVKIISKRSVHSVMNQQQLLQKLKSPFLVNMMYSFQNRENLFLVMDYCNRGDLRYHLGNRRRFSEEQTKFFVACIVICLEYLHSRKVIHRDLKPENLVLDDHGYLRVTDLGVSREVKPNNSEDTSGTPGYMSPEVICKMNHSYPVDFFALGVITYELMMGKRPYVGANRKQIREKIMAKQVQLDQKPLFGWSRQSVDFVNRLIQRKPQNRLGYTGIDELKQHPFLKRIDWQRLGQMKVTSPFTPPTIEQDYSNYKECISEDTEIQDIDEYKMILRHKDTLQAFIGYEYNIASFSKNRNEKRQVEPSRTTMALRKRR